MKQILSSQELNKKFSEAKEQGDKMFASINQIKEDVTKKLSIINYAMDYSNIKLDTINAGVSRDDSKIAFDKNVYGIFDQYGYTIHPKIKSSIDIFNLKLLSSDNTVGRTMFKRAVKCKVNDVENDDYINILMEDNVVDKKIIFDELKEDTIVIEYEIDNQVSIGTSRFNMIEIDPYISGSLDIQSIECYNLDTIGNLSNTPTKIISAIDNIGKTRIILNEKIKFSKVVFTFKCNYSTKVNDVDIYPFGIKHILFKEVDFLLDSFSIVELRNSHLIDYIYNDITLYSVNGRIETTMDMYGIEIYTDYTKVLTGRIYPSTKSQVNRIPKNTKKLYLKIPLVKQNKANDDKEYLSLTGIRVNITTQEDIII